MANSIQQLTASKQPAAAQSSAGGAPQVSQIQRLTEARAQAPSQIRQLTTSLRSPLLKGLRDIVEYSKNEEPDIERTKNFITQAKNNLLRIQRESAGESLTADQKSWYEEMATSYSNVLDYLNDRSMRENSFEFKRNKEDLGEAENTMAKLTQQRDELQAGIAEDEETYGVYGFGSASGQDPRRQEIAGLNEQIAQQQSVIDQLQGKVAAYQPNTNEERDTLIAKQQDPHAYDEELTQKLGYGPQNQWENETTQAEWSAEYKKARSRDRKRLKELDESLYNESQDYTRGDRFNDWWDSTWESIDSSIASAAGTAVRAADEDAKYRMAEGDAGFLGDRSGIPGLEESNEARKAAAAERNVQTSRPADEQAAEEWQRPEWDTMGRVADWLENRADELGASAAEDLRMAKTGAGTGWQVAMDIGTNMIQMGVDAAVGAVTGTGMLPMFTRVFGQEAQQIRQAGGDLNQQLAVGLTKAGIEIFTEKMFDGVAGIFGKGMADDMVEDLVRDLTKNRLGQNLMRAFIGSVGEGGEEVMSDLLGTFSDMVWNKKEFRDAWNDNMEGALYDFLIGAALGGLGGAAGIVGDLTGTNIGGYLEKNEAMKVDRALEEGGVDPALYRQATREYSKGSYGPLKSGLESAWQQGNRVLQERQTKAMEEFRKEALAAINKKSTLSGTVDLNNVTVKFDGTDVKMTGFVRENGKTMVQMELPSGTTFTADPKKVEFYDKTLDGKNVTPEQAQQVLAGKFLEELSKQEHPEVMAMMYNPGQDVGEFINQWNVAERVYGRLARNATLESVQQESVLGSLTPEQISAAYQVGREELQQALARTAVPEGVDVKSLKPGQGKVSYSGATVDGTTYAAVNMTELSEAQRAQIELLETVARVTGVNIVFYQSPVNAQGYYQGANGIYQNGIIYLDVNAGLNQKTADGRTVGEVAIVRAAAHELTHFIQDFSPAQYEKVRSFIIDTLLQEKGYDNLDSLIAEKMTRDQSGKLTRAEAIDEIIADGCEMMLRDSQAIQRLAAEQPGIANRLKRWISQWVKKIQAAFRGVDAQHSEARILMEHAEELQRIWDEAFESAARIAGSEYGRSDNVARESIAAFSPRANLEELDIPWDPDNESSIKEQTVRALDDIKNMPPVHSVTYDKTKGKPYWEQLDDLLNTRFGYKIDRQGFGEFLYDKQAIRTIRHYVGSDEEAAAAIASPYVLKRGKIISGHRRHNNGQYPSVTFSAMVTLNGKPGVESVAVLFGEKDRVHALRILAPDGAEFELTTKKETKPEIEGSGSNEPVTRPTGSESADILSQAEAESKSKMSEREYTGKWKQYNGVEEEAKRHFGTTTDIRTAGYVLPDGTMLDFSGAHWLEGYDAAYIADWRRKNDIRQVDHEDVYEAFDEISDNPPSDSAMVFIERGNIRMSPEAPGIELSAGREPTAEQYAIIRKMVRETSDARSFYVDLMKDGRHGKEKLSYEGGVNADRVVNDIKHYYQTGEVRQQSEVARFRYSEREGQITLDEWTGGELQRSMLHPATREGLNRAAGLRERIKDFYRDTDAERFTDEELDDLLFVDQDKGNRNIKMSDPGTVLRDMSEIAKDRDADTRTQIYTMMEELLGYMDPAQAERWTGMDENRTPNDTAFAEWYNARHPSIYYPGYTPGDLMNNLDNQIREREYLQEMLQRDDLAEEDREQAEDFLRRLSPTTGTGEVFYSEREYAPDERDLVREYAARMGEKSPFMQKWLDKVQRSEALRLRIRDYDTSIRNLEERIRKAEAGEMKLANPERDRETLQKIRDSRAKVAEKLNRMEKVILGLERRQEYRSAVEKTRQEWNADPKETAKLIRELREMNRQLEEQLDYWKQEGRLTDPKERKARRADVERYTRQLAKQIGYRGNMADLIGMMQDAADLVYSEGLSSEELQERARNIARELTMNAVEEFDPEAGLREELKNRLRELRIRPDAEWTGDFGDWNDFRSRNFSKLWFSKEGDNIDDVYQQLRGEFGEGLFPEDITAGSDQIYQILAALDKLQPVETSMFRSSEEMAVVTAALKNEITNTLLYGDIGEELTQADRDYRSLGERLQKAREEAKDAKKTVAELRRAQHLEIQGALMAQRQQFRDREKKQKARARIQKTGLRLAKYLAENDAKKNPIPEPMKEAVGSLLLDLDLSGGLEQKRKNRYIRDMEAVRKIVLQQKAYMAEQTDNWSGMYLDLSQDIIDQLEEHLDKVKDAAERAQESGKIWNPSMMNAEELENLDSILTQVTNAITKSNEILSNARGGKISDAAAAGVRFLNSLAPDRKKRSEKGEALNKFLRWQNTTPYYYFKKFGEPGLQMFENIQDGWDKFAFNARQIIEFAEGVYTAEEAKKIQDEVLTFKLRMRGDMSEGMEKNQEVTMTKAQVMSLYCLWKREQARGHIAGAGIRIADYKQGSQKVSQAENYLIDLEDVAKIIDTMSEREKQIADTLQEYMNTVGSEWGNEVSMKRFGVRSFTEENYFPITTDDRTRQVRNPESDTANLYRLLNMSFTKATVREASNAIVLDNIFDVFSNHMADMAKYNGLGLPMLDAMKWMSYTVLDEKDPESGQYGYESMQKAAERAYGKEARNYFVTFLKDLNGVREGGRGEEFGSKILSNYKVAAVGANLRVAVLQPTSYVRAAAVIDKKYLAQGLKMNNRAGREEAEKYSGTAVWKALGFYDTNINAGLREMIKHTDGLREQIQEVSMKGAEMGDKITWGALWNACRAEQKAQGVPDAELMERTAKRFREVVYRTQVMDSTMTRSHVMRQKGVYAGMVTAFMSEPTLSFNMLLDAYGDYEMRLRQGMNKSAAWQATKGPIVKAFGAYTATAVLSAVVESIIDAARDDDEYASYLERWLEKFWGVNLKKKDLSFGEAIKGFFGGNLMDDLLVHNKLPIIKDFMATLTGGSASGRLDTEWMNNVYKALAIWKESIWLAAGWQEEPTKVTYSGNMTTWGKLYATLRAASQLTGLPVGNAMRDAVAMWNSSVGEFAPGMKIQTYDPGEEKSIMYAVKDGYLTEDEAVQWLMKYELAKDETEARQKVFVWENDGKYVRLKEAVLAGDYDEFLAAQEELMDLKFSPSSIQTAVKAAIEESYIDGVDGVRISKEEAAKRLIEYGILKRDVDAKEQVEKWTSEVVTGIKFDDIDEAYVTGDITRERAQEMLQTYGSMTQEEARAKVQMWTMEVDTGIRYSDLDDAFLYGEITEQQAVQMYMKYGGKSQEDAVLAGRKLAFHKDFGYTMERVNIQADYADGGYTHDQMKRILLDYGYSKTEDSAESTVTRWDFVGQDWSLDSISGYEAQRYYNYNVGAAGISKQEWMDWLEIAKEADKAGRLGGDIKGYSKKGAAIYVPYSKVDKILALIDSFPISDQEKDALFLAGWDSGSEGNSKNLRRAPWHKRR